jgi:cysteine synthase A
LFDGIKEDMSAEEIALSRSTPLCRFDIAPAPATKRQSNRDVNDADATDFVTNIIAREPVVLFALEWCEFCWSVRKFFELLGIHYVSVDLDSVKYQANERGGKIRAALAQRTQAATIPQVFVSGQHIGGSTDLFAAWSSGTLQQLFTKLGIAYDTNVDLDPKTLLPRWLQPRQAS